MRRRHQLAVVLAAAVAWSACSKKSGGAKKIPRDEDAQAVVVVEGGGGEVDLDDEVEPNDSQSEAGAIALGAGVRGVLDGEDDVDLYRFTVEDEGFLRAIVTGIDEVDLILELRNVDDKVLVKSDRGPAGTVEGFPNVEVPPGDYVLAVSEFVKRRRRKRRKKGDEPEGRQGASPPYELTAFFEREQPDEHEVEPNGAAESAGEIRVGFPVFGWLGWNDDVDVWKAPLDAFSDTYRLDVDVSAVPGITPTLSILDDGGKVVLERGGTKGEGVAVRGLLPDLDDAGVAVLYMRLRAKRSNPLDRYELTTKTRLVDPDTEETEPNDEVGTAQPLRGDDDADATEGEMHGFLTIGDVDYYALEAGAEAAVVNVSVEPPSNLDVRLGAVIAKGEQLGVADAGKRGGREELKALTIPAGGTLIVKVAGDGVARDLFPYELSWSLGAAAPAPDDDPMPLEEEYED